MMLEMQVMEIELTFDRLVSLYTHYKSYVLGNDNSMQSDHAAELGLGISGGNHELGRF